MDSEQSVDSLRRQLRNQRIAFALVLFVLITGWAWSHFRNTKSMIIVDGRPVVCVPSVQDANEILSRVKSGAGGDPSQIEFKQDVVVARAPLGAEPVSRHMAYNTMRRILSPVVSHWAIIANGQPVVAVPSKEVAGEVLDLAKFRFGNQVKHLAEEPQFKQNVKVDIASVSPVIFRKTAKEAVDFVFSKDEVAVPRDAVYVVEKGDVAGEIAARYRIPLKDLIALNPGRDLARLQIGDKVRVRATALPKPKLTIVVRDQSEQTETMPPPVQQVSSAQIPVGSTTVLSAGRSGQRKVTVATIYENGCKTGSEVISEEILRDPSPRIVAVGIKAH